MDGQKTARMGTKYVQDNVGIFLDFLTPELYLIEIVRTKDRTNRGMEPKYYLMDIAIAVDDNKSYKFEAKCAEDEAVSECFVPQSKNDELVKLFKSGNKVNFKIGNLDLYFSLSGFSKAFSRASRLVRYGFNKKILPHLAGNEGLSIQSISTFEIRRYNELPSLQSSYLMNKKH